MGHILVVDDEPGVRESLRMLLSDSHRVTGVADVASASAVLRDELVDLVLLDLVMPGRSGFELLAELARAEDAPPAIVVTATRTVATAVEAMKQGAGDYVTKPFEVDELRIKVARLLEQRALSREVAALREEVAGRGRLGDLLGQSPNMQEVFRTVRRAAPSRASVLIRGESGTGKELVARAIHAHSERASGPFVAVNCAAIPDTLIESELFGHEKGAFTGASDRRIGRFEAASGGTLFLDEIGELTPAVQPKLLRVLQERTVERVGATEPVPVDVRLVVATHRDLEQEVAEGRFRADLFYRINVLPIELPPLRERREDIRALASHFLERERQAAGRGPRRFAREALTALERYPWPGNVRELSNAVERAVALCESEAIGLADLPEALVRESRLDDLRDALRAGRLGFEEVTARFERELLLEALEAEGWNQTRAALRLQLTRRALKLRMDRLGLKPPS